VKGFAAIAELIRRSGSPTVFAVMASTNSPYLAEGVRTGAFPLVRTRHEETAANAAAGFSRASGLVGIASVQRGPGLANAVNALMVAKSVHAPMLVLVAESPPSKDDTAKEVNQRALVEAIGVGFHHAAGPDELEQQYWCALRDATWNGIPQVLSIGDGITAAEIELTDGRLPSHDCDAAPDAESVAAAVDVLAAARRPLIVAGHGAVHAHCRRDLEELAALAGARVANSLYGARFFSGHPHDLGLCGTWAPAIVHRHFAETDVVLAFGASMNRHTTAKRTIFGNVTAIHCEIDPNQPLMVSRPDLALIGDAGAVARALIAEWRARGLPARAVEGSTPSREEITRSVLAVDLGHDPVRGLDLRRVYAEFDRRFPADRIVVTDSGRHVSCLPSIVNARDARSFVMSRGYGSVGMGMGAAIGAAAAHPDRKVLLFCGDGGFTMAMQELDTIGSHRLDITIVVINDLMYGAEVNYLRDFGFPPDVLRMGFPDVELLARAHGGVGFAVRTEEELCALDLPDSGLVVVDARVDPEVSGRAAVG
jgi:thiamine pyrophosphate-dependent acetolactate synthase large subunit-like protein